MVIVSQLIFNGIYLEFIDLRIEDSLSINIRRGAHTGSRLHANAVWFWCSQIAVVLLKKKRVGRGLINTVQGLLLSVNGLDLGYWVQS